MRRVILESPFAAPTPEGVQAHIDYARRCVRDSLLRGEAPIASHMLYTQSGILDDNDPAERQHGIDAGLAWRTVAERSVVYVDLGISKGMEYGIKAAIEAGVPVEYRRIFPTSPTIFPSSSKWRLQSGCAVCFLGGDGKPMGYACPRNDCPTKAIA